MASSSTRSHADARSRARVIVARASDAARAHASATINISRLRDVADRYDVFLLDQFGAYERCLANARVRSR